MADDNKICFVIAPIGDPDSDTRKRSDQILKHVVKPAAKHCGYDAIRADEIAEPGIITTQVIQHIIDDPMVVADLTGRNPNVFYELAVRHALRRPYVQLIQRGERIPFDVAGVRTIEVDNRDLDSVEAAKVDIIRQMTLMQAAHALVDSPISVAVDLEKLKRSDNPEERHLADVLAAISDLRSGLLSVEQRLLDPTTLLPPTYLRSALLSVMDNWSRVNPTFRHLADLRFMVDRLSKFEEKDWAQQSEQITMAIHGIRSLVSRMQQDEGTDDQRPRVGRSGVD
jgi:hypothetical protein